MMLCHTASDMAFFGQGKCRKAAVPETVPGTNAHEATVGGAPWEGERVGNPGARRPVSKSAHTTFATGDCRRRATCFDGVPMSPQQRRWGRDFFMALRWGMTTRTSRGPMEQVSDERYQEKAALRRQGSRPNGAWSFK